jgi:hypothetical protein
VKTFLMLFAVMFTVFTVEGVMPPNHLVKATKVAESKCQNGLVGDTNQTHWAYGMFQVSQPVCDEYNEANGTNLRADKDCRWDPELSSKVFCWYVNKWATAERLGHQPTLEDMADRITSTALSRKIQRRSRRWHDFSGAPRSTGKRGFGRTSKHKITRMVRKAWGR